MGPKIFAALERRTNFVIFNLGVSGGSIKRVAGTRAGIAISKRFHHLIKGYKDEIENSVIKILAGLVGREYPCASEEKRGPTGLFLFPNAEL